ncbi:PREDICTED: uncharacterized protein LOC109361913 [Lupinus angustifolius]|uniref:uncharacterized protein LOC109361911 n=1 Tax=Lupinus angustifolius TaxID=3871 RepID=UPI00092E955C|nr:PREDICTED: uncharacterized protein LOC109361911 [Lupinus angustifolius]XP_019462983.1 PREDICTED: uncharacterized protein LOC109361913 [Lupinus angustifolius]
MTGCNSTETPTETNLKLRNCDEEAATDETIFRQIVGSLRYLCHSRPEICYGVGVISRFMSKPKYSHMLASKRILRYLKATLNYDIVFPHQDEKTRSQLMAYTNSDWCGDILDRKSTMGYVFLIGGVPISWCSKKQKVVPLSIYEAGYIDACATTC